MKSFRGLWLSPPAFLFAALIPCIGECVGVTHYHAIRLTADECSDFPPFLKSDCLALSVLYNIFAIRSINTTVTIKNKAWLCC